MSTRQSRIVSIAITLLVLGATPTHAQSLPASCTFTDDPVIAGVTVVKAVHVTQLRVCINDVRIQRSLSTVTWTDSTLTAQQSTVKAVHVIEIRSAIAAIYTAAGTSAPQFTDTITATTTTIRAVHFNELRSAIRNVPAQSSCASSITPMSSTVSSSAGSLTINITAPTGCNWSTSTSSSFLHLASASTGSGNGSVSYNIDSNGSTSSRTGGMQVAGFTATVVQASVNGCTDCGYSQPVGITVGYDAQEDVNACTIVTHDPSVHPPIIQVPLYKPYSRDTHQWWDNLVEEMAFTNIHYAAMNVRGHSPCNAQPGPAGNEPPELVQEMVDALNRRGYGNILKIAYQDDTGSQPLLKKQCTGSSSFDLSDESLWQQYFWEAKYKPFFDRVPDNLRMKVQGRPLVFFWAVPEDFGPEVPAYYNHGNGNLSRLIDYIRARSMSTPGLEFNPFIVVNWGWYYFDPTVADHVDGIDKWFNTSPEPNWSLFPHPTTGFKVGIAQPGFWYADATTTLFTDRDNGNALRNAFANIAPADLILLEGFTDVPENAGFYRGAMIPPPSCGNPIPLPPNQTWSHPNQYLNIVREFTAPLAKFVVFEAEAADAYAGPGPSPSGLYRRTDSQQIEYTDGTQSQWGLRLNGSWARFHDFELGSEDSWTWRTKYRSPNGTTLRLKIDGVEVAAVSAPARSSYGNIDVTGFGITAGHHDVELWADGDAYIDSWTLDGLHSIAPAGPSVRTSEQAIYAGQSVYSPDGRFHLTFENTGNLVLFRYDGTIAWQTETLASGATPLWMLLQADGNFVMYYSNGAPWTSGTGGHPGAYLVVRNDGHVVIYDQSGSQLWNKP